MAEVRHHRECLTSHILSDAQWHAIEIAVTPNSLGVLMRETKHKSSEYTKKVNMIKINKLFDKYFDLCENILF